MKRYMISSSVLFEVPTAHLYSFRLASHKYSQIPLKDEDLLLSSLPTKPNGGGGRRRRRKIVPRVKIISE